MSKETSASDLVGCIVSLVVWPIGTVARGYVLVKLWAWFVMPVFGLPALTIGYALGIACLLNYVTAQSADYVRPERTPREAAIFSILNALLTPVLVFAFGWIVTVVQGR